MTIADTLRQLGLSAPDPRSDGELLGRFVRTRDEIAFAELFRRHGPTVYGVCRRVVGTGPDADDAFQAVFLVLARKAGTVRPPGMIGNWLYGVAVRTANKARVMNAKKANRRCEPPGGLEQHPAIHTAGSPDRDTLAVIDAELAALPAVYRAAFVVCDLNGRSRSEAARELGWPEGTVAARVAKARELLAARLRKRGVALGVGLFAAVAVPTATATETLLAVQELLAVGTAIAVAPAAQSLSDEVMQSMTTIHAKWLAAVCVLTLTLATGGAVLLAGRPDKTPPVREPIKAPVPKVTETVWKEETPIEFKDNGRVTSIAFAPSGKTFAVCRANGLIDFYDPTTRKHQQSMNFLGDPRSNPTRKAGTYPTIAFRPRPHAKLGDVFAVTHKNGVSFGTTDIGLLVDAPPAIEDIPSHWEGENLDPHGVVWLTSKDGSERLAMTNGAITTARGTTGQDTGFQLFGWKESHHKPFPFAALPGDRLLTAINDPDDKDTERTLYIVPPTDTGERTKLAGHKSRPTCTAAASDGTRIVSTDEKGTLIAWEGKDAKFEEKRRVELGDGVVQLALAPDGKTVAVLRVTKGMKLQKNPFEWTELRLYVFDITNPPAKPDPLWTTEPLILGDFNGPASLAFSPDGKTLLAAFGDPYPGVDRGLDGADPEAKSLGVRVWTLAGEKIKAPVPKAVETEWKEAKAIELKDGARVTAVTFSPDGSTIVVGQKSDVVAIDTKTRQERLVLKIKEAENQIFCIRYKPDGTRLGIANRNSYGLGTTKLKIGTSDYSTWAGQMTNVAFSPDGARFAASDGRTVMVHSLRKEKEEPLQFGPPVGLDNRQGDIPSAIAFSPKGDQLILLPNVRVPADWQYDPKTGFTMSDPKAATHWVAVVWSLEGEELKVLKHDKARLAVADWSADGQYIVTGDDRGTLFIWDGKTFKEKARLNLGQGLVQLALAPDGKTVAALRAVRSRPESELDQTDFELFVFDLTDPPAKPKPLWKTEKPFSWGFAGPASLAFSPDGKTLLAAFADPYHDVTSGGKTPKSSGIRVWELVPKK